MAKGKLVDKARNVIFKCEEPIPRRKTKQSNNALHENEKEEIIAAKVQRLIQDDTSNNENVLWLKLNREPWTEVVSKWEQTVGIRDVQRQNSAGTVAQFIELWPVLKDLRGDVLVGCS